VKLASVAKDALPQIDEDVERMLARGIQLADGRTFALSKIRFVVKGEAPAPLLTTYIEGATTNTWVQTSAGRPVQRVEVAGAEQPP
jgi:hypothetical protein